VLLFLLCMIAVFGLPLLLAASTRLVVTGASEFRARVLETLASAVHRGVAVEPQFLWLMAHDVRGRRQRAVRQAARDLDDGHPLSYALAGALRLPAADGAAIAAAEGTPHLVNTLRQTANADRLRWSYRHQLLIRLAYPALVLTFLGGFVGIGIGPKFVEICASMDVDSSAFMRSFEVARALGLTVGAVALLVALSGIGWVRARFVWIRGLRGTVSADRASGWLRALAAAIRAGRPLQDALERTATALGHRRHVRRTQAVAGQIREGMPVDQAWGRLPVAAWLRARAPLVAGTPETLAATLEDLSTTAEDGVRDVQARILHLLSPLLLTATGAILALVLGTFLAMLHEIRTQELPW
jgi:type II secretory pathway component PulF